MNTHGSTGQRVVAIVSRTQALDKTTAILAQMRRDVRCHRTVLVELDEKAHQDVLAGLLTGIAAVAESVIVSTNSHLREWLASELERLGKCVIIADASVIESLLRDHPEGESTAVLAPIGPIGPCAQSVVIWAREHGHSLVGFFKSLHDEGLGLTTVPLRGWRRWATSVKSRLRGLGSQVRASRFLRPHDFTMLMSFSARHERVIAPLAGAAQLFRSGYPILYPAWQELQSSITSTAPLSPHEGRTCVLFTRGQAGTKTPESSVVSDDDCLMLASDVVRALRFRRESWRVIIKPHPQQATDRLRAMFALDSDVSFSDQSAGAIVKSADLVVATYSSTVIDAVAIGVPAIEYFCEKEFFRRKHPTGSPFIQFGVLPARNREQLADRISEAMNNLVCRSPLLNDLRIVPDFSRLWPS